jgi:hypothetical protein
MLEQAVAPCVCETETRHSAGLVGEEQVCCVESVGVTGCCLPPAAIHGNAAGERSVALLSTRPGRARQAR